MDFLHGQQSVFPEETRGDSGCDFEVPPATSGASSGHSRRGAGVIRGAVGTEKLPRLVWYHDLCLMGPSPQPFPSVGGFETYPL